MATGPHLDGRGIRARPGGEKLLSKGLALGEVSTRENDCVGNAGATQGEDRELVQERATRGTRRIFPLWATRASPRPAALTRATVAPGSPQHARFACPFRKSRVAVWRPIPLVGPVMRTVQRGDLEASSAATKSTSRRNLIVQFCAGEEWAIEEQCVGGLDGTMAQGNRGERGARAQARRAFVGASEAKTTERRRTANIASNAAPMALIDCPMVIVWREKTVAKLDQRLRARSRTTKREGEQALSARAGEGASLPRGGSRS